jgi:hypothetical protein
MRANWQFSVSGAQEDSSRMSNVDTCNALVSAAIHLLGGSSGINSQLPGGIAPVGSLLKFSGPVDVYEKAASIRYPVVNVHCERLRNTQREKYLSLSGEATLVVEVKVSGTNSDQLETSLNSYVEATCQCLQSARGTWTSAGTYSGNYDVKFQPLRTGGKQFVKSARIEFDIHVSQ